VQNPLLKRAYDLYSTEIIPKMGSAIAGDADSYEYLVESIRKFPKASALKSRMDESGFQNTRFNVLSGGIVAIHYGNSV